MSVLRKYIDSAFSPFSGAKTEERINQIVEYVKTGLQNQTSSYRLSHALQEIDHKPSDIPVVQGRVYYSLLSRIWEDHIYSDEEEKTATWVARSLEISPAYAKAMNLKFAKSSFAAVLADAMIDNRLDDSEAAFLTNIACAADYSLQDFVQLFFKAEGAAFLRSIFLAYIEDEKLTQAEWHKLLLTSRYLGVSKDELQLIVSNQANSFVENVLANAKADGRLTDQEIATLHWLLDEFAPSPVFRKYVENEIQEMRKLEDIENGRLPIVNPDKGIQLQAGEMLHFKASAVWEQTRMLKSGPQVDCSNGKLLLTDSRIIFSSSEKPHSIKYAKILSYDGNSSRLEIQAEGKPAQIYRLKTGQATFYPIFRTALAIANQTKVPKLSEKPSRHIPRDVRQRVWQKYAGRCVDCEATDYLEFDHIIPVAKGGSNAESNIQILCRRCNLKKSDRI